MFTVSETLDQMRESALDNLRLVVLIRKIYPALLALPCVGPDSVKSLMARCLTMTHADAVAAIGDWLDRWYPGQTVKGLINDRTKTA